MTNPVETAFLQELSRRYGSISKLERSLSLFEVGQGALRIYVRYSKVHGGRQAFYGLRQDDLRRLEGHPSVICFLWDSQTEPLFVPFLEYEEVFQSTAPAADGQYKAQVYLKGAGIELYVAGAGRFNVDAYLGWEGMTDLIDATRLAPSSQFSHSQIQTLLGGIGTAKGYDVWIPLVDRAKLEWSLTNHFECRETLPAGFGDITSIIEEVDVIWIEHGASSLRALFEVEHSTPVYSGLLRLNDIHLATPRMRPRFNIVANDERRVLFVRQINRPTFRASGLLDLCNFIEYGDVDRWHRRMVPQ